MFSEHLPHLFHRALLRDFLEQRKRDMEQEIEALNKNRFLSASVEELTDYFVSRYGLTVPQLRRPDAELEHDEVEIDARKFGGDFMFHEGARIQGNRWTLHVPFVGNAELFEYQPSTFTLSGTPIAEISGSTLVMTAERQSSDAPSVVKNGFDTALNEVEQWLRWVANDTNTWMAALPGAAISRIQSRREKLLAAQSAMASMGFKLRERPGETKTFAAPEVRRKVQTRMEPPPQLPGSEAPYKLEPTLTDSDYDHILSVISSMATVIERSPGAFAEMGEEHLRFLFLVPLNGHYEGQATGETFNFSGKTDILIRVQDRNIFIAECKFWTGAKGLSKTIDQLLGYTSWRDTKTAIILFNRNKDFSAVLDQIRPTVEAHPQFKSFISRTSESQFRFVFKQSGDATRDLRLTVLVFNVPQSEHAVSSGATAPEGTRSV